MTTDEKRALVEALADYKKDLDSLRNDLLSEKGDNPCDEDPDSAFLHLCEGFMVSLCEMLYGILASLIEEAETENDADKQSAECQKYEIAETLVFHENIKMYRIRALCDIPRYGVKAGDLGGLIQSEDNLSQEGDCWVAFGASVTGDATVSGNALVHGHACVCGRASIFDDARVYGDVHIDGCAKVYQESEVSGYAQITGDAEIFGHAHVYSNAEIWGNARIYDSAFVGKNADIHGDAEINGTSVVGGQRVIICGDARVSGKSNISWGFAQGGTIIDKTIDDGSVMLY